MTPWREKVPEELNDELELEVEAPGAGESSDVDLDDRRKTSGLERLNARRRVTATNTWRTFGAAFWPRLGWQLPLALASSMALLVFALIHPRPSTAPLIHKNAAPVSTATIQDWTSVDLGAVGKLRVQANTTYRLPGPARSGEYRIALDDGALCAEVIAHRRPAGRRATAADRARCRCRWSSWARDFVSRPGGGISTVAVSEGRVQAR